MEHLKQWTRGQKSGGGQYFQRFTSRLSILATLPTLHTLVSVRISCVLLFIHLLLQRQKEVVYQSRAYLVRDHLLYSHNLSVWFRADNVGMIVTLKGLGVEAVFNNYNRSKNYWNFTRFTEGQIPLGTRHNSINLKIFNFFFREGGRGERRSLGFQKERGLGEISRFRV